MKSFSVAARLSLCAAIAAAGCSKANFGDTKAVTVPRAAKTPAEGASSVATSRPAPSEADAAAIVPSSPVPSPNVASPIVPPLNAPSTAVVKDSVVPPVQAPQTPTEPIKIAPDVAFDLSCAAELASVYSFMTTAGAAKHFLNVNPTCSSMRTTTSTQLGNTAVDIVFVIDVTNSMGPSIASIRTSVQQFVDKLVTRGWNARFAALAFRDTHDGDGSVPRMVPFGNAAQISTALATWEAFGGGDGQEGSQDAVGYAFDLIQTAGRPSAQKVIMLVSDVVGYAMSPNAAAGELASHSDFSVTALAAKLKSANVGPLKVFSSVYAEPVNDGFVLLPSATKQWDDLRQQSGIPGENLSFPLTESVMLDQFATKFEVVNSQEELVCRLQSVTLEGAAAPVKLASGVQRLALGTQVQTTASAGKVLEVKRCCSVKSSATATLAEPVVCADPVTHRVTLGLTK